MNDAVLDELRRTGEELRQVFADERAAITKLDHAALDTVAARKAALATRLEALRAQVSGDDPLVRALFVAIRAEAQATAILAAAATQAVRAMLGYQPSSSYDRRAQQQASRTGRILARY